MIEGLPLESENRKSQFALQNKKEVIAAFLTACNTAHVGAALRSRESPAESSNSIN